VKCAVLGTGMVGRTLAARLAELGHTVVIGTRDPQATRSRTEAGGNPYAEWAAAHDDVGLATFADAAAEADLVVNATPGSASLAVLGLAGAEYLAGKVLVDISNPLDFSQGMPPTLFVKDTDSLGEQIQRAFPDTKVVKTLNTVNHLVMVEPERVPGDHIVYVAGNDASARAQVAGWLHEWFGWKQGSIIDVGDITAARGLEMLLPHWVRLMVTFGSPMFNFTIAR
jgi:predicted dinucleotide-binding enzyme